MIVKKKTMFCIWWDQEDVVYHELVKSCETGNSGRCQQQIVNLNQTLIVKRPLWASRPGKMILLHDNASPHASKPVKDTLRSCQGSITPPAVFARIRTVRFSHVPVNDPHTVSAELPNVRRYGPMDHRLICLQRSKILLRRYRNFTGQIGKMCS
ncbi:Mariner Mos1 transposase [Araneus ventricosus]|uniref:Mariner Mos1 transposase n=1 Tax=Araneus ventricosus TaxID=182803 RepID=A0A4Y2LLE6_ARAVE|nr:Mariner Mos1 transposase [Araneus ventricosus]